MKTLHLYLARQVLASLLLTVAVFTFVMLLGNVLKEVLPLLINRQASFLSVLQAIGLLVPYVLVFALPMGLLTSTLLVFGRFSADNELTAVRASGISLLSLITPVLVISVLLSGLCACVNLWWAPQCRVEFKHMLFRLGVERLHAFIPERTFIREWEPYVAYFEHVDGPKLREVTLYQMDKSGTNLVRTIRAASGTFALDKPNHRIVLTLFDARMISAGENGETDRTPAFAGEYGPIYIPVREKEEREPGLSDLTFEQLQERRQQLEAKGIGSPTPILVQIHSQVAFSFACVAFTLVGIPLGIRAHRRETSAGIAMALVLVILYYSVLFLAQSFESKPHLYPYLVAWVPNFVFQAVGMFLLRRANRGI